MVNSIRGKHAGISVAVLGSSTTLGLFKGEQPISIAVNGAAKVVASTYFVCADIRGSKRDWFYASPYTTTRIVSSYISPFDKLCFPSPDDRERLQRDLSDFLYNDYIDEEELLHYIFTLMEDSISSNDCVYESFRPELIPCPPHLYFDYTKSGKINVSKTQENIFRGGSVSGCALQIASIMSASEIHLYGCSFDNDSGRNYAYAAPTDQHGEIKTHHHVNMDRIIEQIMLQGV